MEIFSETAEPEAETEGYQLDEQVGFLLRRAHQRHLTIFGERMVEGLTAVQFSLLLRLVRSDEPMSQNAVGRSVAMDAATTKGVVQRLQARGLISTERDLEDNRRYVLKPTAQGRELIERALPAASTITDETLSPLNPTERKRLLSLLKKLT